MVNIFMSMQILWMCSEKLHRGGVMLTLRIVMLTQETGVREEFDYIFGFITHCPLEDMAIILKK